MNYTGSSGVECPYCHQEVILYPYGMRAAKYCMYCGGDLQDMWVDMSNPMDGEG